MVGIHFYIIAAGSAAVHLPAARPRIVDSLRRRARLAPGAEQMLVIGGGIIGLEIIRCLDPGCRRRGAGCSLRLMVGCSTPSGMGEAERPLRRRHHAQTNEVTVEAKRQPAGEVRGRQGTLDGALT